MNMTRNVRKVRKNIKSRSAWKGGWKAHKVQQRKRKQHRQMQEQQHHPDL